MTIACGHWSRRVHPKPEPGPLSGEEMRRSAIVPENLAARFRHDAEPAQNCRLRRAVALSIVSHEGAKSRVAVASPFRPPVWLTGPRPTGFSMFFW
jgi:hypothetical protein